jgi:hypothetical protein
MAVKEFFLLACTGCFDVRARNSHSFSVHFVSFAFLSLNQVFLWITLSEFRLSITCRITIDTSMVTSVIGI